MLSGFDLDFLYATDPVLRVNRTFGLGFKLDPVQEQIIRSDSERLIVCCSRQWGKTTTVAAKAAAEALDQPGLVLVLAPVERQARECFRKIKGCLVRGAPRLRYLEDNKTSCELENGARIVVAAARGENIRGFSNPRVVIIDEAAFVADEDYRAVRPMLSHGGRLILLSTPFGKRGFFHDEWNDLRGPWERYTVAAEDCSHIKASFLEEERVSLGPWWYEQEYECKFLDSIAGFFDMGAVRDALEAGVSPLFTQRGDGHEDYVCADVLPLFA